MPVEPIRPMSRQEEIREDRQKITITSVIQNKFHVFNMAVAVTDDVVDFTDIPSGNAITGALACFQTPITFKVKDDVGVYIADPWQTHAKVTVETESGFSYKPPGYLYWTRDNFRNINGRYCFNDPTFTSDSLTISTQVLQETYCYKRPVVPGLPIYCGHYATEVLRLRGEADWKRVCDRHLAVKNLPNVFTDFQAIENEYADIIIGTRHTFASSRHNLGNLLHGMLSRMSANMLPDSVIEKKYFTLLTKAGEPAGNKHACAIILRCKKDSDGFVVHKIKVYDPNMTYNSLSMVDFPHMGFVKAMKFADLFGDKVEYASFDAVSLYELNDEWDEGEFQMDETTKHDGMVYQYKYSSDEDRLVCVKKEFILNRLEGIHFVKVNEESIANN